MSLGNERVSSHLGIHTPADKDTHAMRASEALVEIRALRVFARALPWITVPKIYKHLQLAINYSFVHWNKYHYRKLQQYLDIKKRI